MSVNATHTNDLERATKHVEKLIELSRPRGPLSDVQRKRVAQVSRTAKWLRKAIGEMVHDDPQLVKLLPEIAIKPAISNAELDALVLSRRK